MRETRHIFIQQSPGVCVWGWFGEVLMFSLCSFPFFLFSENTKLLWNGAALISKVVLFLIPFSMFPAILQNSGECLV